MEKKWLNYWKKNLSDSLNTDIDVDQLHHFEVENFKINSKFIKEIGEVNALIDYKEDRINKKNGIDSKESNNWKKVEKIQVLISPLKLTPKSEHLIIFNNRKPKFPFWYYANLNRYGELSVPEETFPIFQRKYLEPLADEKTEFIFSSVEKVDKATSIGKEEYNSFEEYVEYVKTVFEISVDSTLEDYKAEGYESISNAIILLPNEDTNAAIGIIHHYEKIIRETNIPALLSNLINLKNDKADQPLSVSEFIEVNALHLGQMGFDFPLSFSQRKSLYTMLHKESKIFAVNGPPGTGKTTLLQSIVANKIVESALTENDPAIILACSTNNQAVTNIIDSFSKSNTAKGHLQGRWLPDIDGYATYLPASLKTQAELQGINYKKLRGEGLFNNIENYPYLEKAKTYYLQKCSTYFKAEDIQIDESIKMLQNEIKYIQSLLVDATQKWKEYLKAERQFVSSYYIGNTDKNLYYSDHLLNESTFNLDVQALHKLEGQIILYFKNEPFFRKLFCFLGIKFSLKNRASELRIILRDSLIQQATNFEFIKSAILELIDSKIKIAKAIHKIVFEWKQWKSKNTIKGNPPKTKEEYWEFEHAQNEGIKKQSKQLSTPNYFFDELDVTLRHKAFQLALHYWEGRWLLKLEQDLASNIFKSQKDSGRTEENVKNRWKRQAMLTPCFVSTFYMTPKFFDYFKYLGRFENGGYVPNNLPLYNFIDLLIVDEAGQVAPEIGIATFTLAKQAVVVGDIKQIEPIWNVSNKIDVGNLMKEQLIKNYDDLTFEKEFDPKGFLSSTGSLMKMAQNACNYKEEHLTEKGIILVEHRRCYNEIIKYFNILAYDGQLKPLRGKAKQDNLFPPMLCIHVDGNSNIISKSRYNQNEVVAIINWLKFNKQKIETKYGKIEDAVGIITPFVGQKSRLQHALNNAGFDTTKLKLGTVHALQGAERPIILLSMVYGKGDSGTMFFDRENKPNMLNVAVSRAKDNFIVFANTEIFNKNAKTPSGILSNYLTYEVKNITI